MRIWSYSKVYIIWIFDLAQLGILEINIPTWELYGEKRWSWFPKC